MQNDTKSILLGEDEKLKTLSTILPPRLLLENPYFLLNKYMSYLQYLNFVCFNHGFSLFISKTFSIPSGFIL